MKKNIFSQKVIVSLFSLLPLISVAAVAEETNCKTNLMKDNILKTLSSIINYKVNMQANFNNTKIHSKIFGQPPNKLKVFSTFDDAYNTTTLNLYDGSYQWVETKRGSQSQTVRINLSQTTNKNTPFDSNYYVYGTGLLSGEDYLGTIKSILSIYKLTANCDNQKIIFTGTIDRRNFKKYAENKKSFKKNSTQIKSFQNTFSKIIIIFDKDKSSPIEYALGNKTNPKVFHVTFKNLIINKGLLKNEFKYKDVKGSPATDITKSLLN